MISPSKSPEAVRDVADLLTGTFPGHTMQRLRTPEGKYRYTYVSSGVSKSFGLDPYELMRMEEADHSWLHPADKDRFIGALEHSAENLTQLDIEVRVSNGQGTYKWVRSLGRPRRLEDGSTLWDGVALDVTDRYEALEALERTLHQVRQNEASEGRFSYIAASDVNDRLSELRSAISALEQIEAGDGMRAAIANVQRRFGQFEKALGAARDLVQSGNRGTTGGVGKPVERPSLTKRQREIMDHVVGGNSNHDIADALQISEGTVKLHISSILKRLGVRNRTEAANKWRSD